MTKTKIAALTLTVLSVLGAALAPSDASAQRRVYMPRNGVRRDWTVRPLVVRTERESNAFRAWFERSANRRDSVLIRNVQRLDESLERLRDRASDNRRGAGREELQSALTYARIIDRQMNRGTTRRVVVREWTDLRRTLNDLARLYNVRRV